MEFTWISTNPSLPIAGLVICIALKVTMAPEHVAHVDSGEQVPCWSFCSWCDVLLNSSLQLSNSQQGKKVAVMLTSKIMRVVIFTVAKIR